MSSSAARRIARRDEGLTTDQRQILAAQGDDSGPVSPDLLAAIDEGLAEAERGDFVDADVVLNELRARRRAAG
jgi:hypothetical protein